MIFSKLAGQKLLVSEPSPFKTYIKYEIFNKKYDKLYKNTQITP